MYNTLILFLIGILWFLLYRKNIILIIIISIEAMLLSIANLLSVSFLNVKAQALTISQTWAIFIIAMYLAGVEFAIGLGILATFYRLRLSLNLEYKPVYLNIITLSLLGSMVSGFFGRKVGVSGAQFITCFSVIVTTLLAAIAFFEVGFKNIYGLKVLSRFIANSWFNSIYGFEFNSFGTNRNKPFILNNKVYFSTSSINLGYSNNLKSAVLYTNADIDKEKIVNENRHKPGVYRWTNLKTGFSYVGSSVNLAKRFGTYYNYSFLTKNKMIISKAILKHGYSNFKLEILEYCAPEKCIEREQYYIDTFKPEYNILKVAGSTLGYKHTEETLAKFKERKMTSNQLEKLRAHLTELNQSEKQRFGARERMLKINEGKGIKVEVTDLKTNETTIYNSIRKTAEALSTDLKAISYNEKVQKERGRLVPFKKHYIIKINRDSNRTEDGS